jgi:hypothetical protein
MTVAASLGVAGGCVPAMISLARSATGAGSLNEAGWPGT